MKKIQRLLSVILSVCMAFSAFSLAAAAQDETQLPPVRSDAGTITYGLEICKVTGNAFSPLAADAALKPGDVVEVRVLFGTDFYAQLINCLVLYNTDYFAPYADGSALNGADSTPFRSGAFQTYRDTAPRVTLQSGAQGTFYDTLSVSAGLTGTTNDNRVRNTYMPLYMRQGYADGTVTQSSAVLPEYASLGFMFAAFMTGRDSALEGEMMQVPYAPYFSFRLIVRDGADSDADTASIFIPVQAQRTADTIIQQCNCLCGYTSDRSTPDGAVILTYGQGVRFAGGNWEGYIGHGPHVWDNGPITTPAECENSGERTFTCVVCGKQRTEPIDPLGHIWLQTERKEASCSQEGYAVYHCARDNAHTYTETLEKTEHSWCTDPLITRQPTCSVPGEKVYTCTSCGAVRTEEIPTTEHVWNDGEWLNEWATCTLLMKQYTCLNCGATKRETFDGPGHQWDDGVTVQEPTCTESGKMVYTCTVCERTRTKTISKTDHTWDEGVVTVEPTHSAYGSINYTCLVCGLTKTERLARTGHQWSEETVFVEPTCTSEGQRGFYCLICGQKFTQTIPPTDHAWDVVVTREATCTQEGEQTFTCAVCGETETETIPTLPHRYGSGVVTREATCAQEGERTLTCTVCGETVSESIPKAEHTFDGGSSVVTREATCAQEGERTFTCAVCGETATEAIPRVPHTVAEWVIVRPATPERSGIKRGACTICGAMSNMFFPYTEEPQALLRVGSGTAAPGGTIQVAVSVQDNPGLAALMLRISYDRDVLTLASVSDGGLLGKGSFQAGNDLTAVPYTVLWADSLASQNHTQDGDLLILTFRVAENAQNGETTVTVSYDADSTVNVDLEPVTFQTESGTIRVSGRIAGDVNGDGSVDLKDVTILRRYLAGGWDVTIDEENADVNGSGTVTLVDVILITRFLAGGWNVTLQ